MTSSQNNQFTPQNNQNSLKFKYFYNKLKGHHIKDLLQANSCRKKSNQIFLLSKTSQTTSHDKSLF